MDVNSLRTRVGFGIFVTQLADSKPQTARRGIGDSRDEPGFWMCRASPSPLLNTCCAGRLPILGYPVTKMLEHTLARRAVDAVDFRPSRNGDGIAHSCHRNSMCKRAARCGAGSRTLAFLDPMVWHGASARLGEGQREMRRCKQAHSCLPTPNSMCKRGARCGAGSRTLAFLDFEINFDCNTIYQIQLNI